MSDENFRRPGNDDEAQASSGEGSPQATPEPRVARFDPYTGEPLDKSSMRSNGPSEPDVPEPTAGLISTPPPAPEHLSAEIGQQASPNSKLAEKRKRPPSWMIVTAAVVIVLIAIGGFLVWDRTVGPTAKAEAARVEKAKQRAAVAEARAEAEKKAEEAQQAEAERQAACVGQLQDTFDALTEIDARLDVGLVENDLSSLAGDASVAINRVDVATVMTNDCAAYPLLKKAMAKYSASASDWNDCITDYNCDTDDKNWSLMNLQLPWLEASDALDKVKHMGLGAASTPGGGTT